MLLARFTASKTSGYGGVGEQNTELARAMYGPVLPGYGQVPIEEGAAGNPIAPVKKAAFIAPQGCNLLP